MITITAYYAPCRADDPPGEMASGAHAVATTPKRNGATRNENGAGI